MSMQWLRLLGAGLLTAAGGMLGYAKKAELQRQKSALEQLCRALGRMACALTELQTPMPQLLKQLEDCPFFLLLSAGFGTQPLETLWRRAAAVQPIPEPERRALAELGSVVGRCGARQQAAEMQLLRQRLAAGAEKAGQELARRGCRYAGLGAALGAMAAVLLL